jgi:hypothetical protein
MEARNCKNKFCKNTFRINKEHNQEHCSEACRYWDKGTGGKLPLNTYTAEDIGPITGLIFNRGYVAMGET